MDIERALEAGVKLCGTQHLQLGRRELERERMPLEERDLAAQGRSPSFVKPLEGGSFLAVTQGGGILRIPWRTNEAAEAGTSSDAVSAIEGATFARIRKALGIQEANFFASVALQAGRTESDMKCIPTSQASGKSKAFFFFSPDQVGAARAHPRRPAPPAPSDVPSQHVDVAAC